MGRWSFIVNALMVLSLISGLAVDVVVPESCPVWVMLLSTVLGAMLLAGQGKKTQPMVNVLLHASDEALIEMFSGEKGPLKLPASGHSMWAPWAWQQVLAGWGDTGTNLRGCYPTPPPPGDDNPQVNQEVAALRAQLAPFLQLLQETGCSSAAELGIRLADTEDALDFSHGIARNYIDLYNVTAHESTLQRREITELCATINQQHSSCAAWEAKWLDVDSRHKALEWEFKLTVATHQEEAGKLQQTVRQLKDTVDELQDIGVYSQRALERALSHAVDNEQKSQQAALTEAVSANLAIDLQQRLGTTAAALAAEQAKSSSLEQVNALLLEQLQDVQDKAEELQQQLVAEQAVVAEASYAAQAMAALGVVIEWMQQQASAERCGLLQAIAQRDHCIEEVCMVLLHTAVPSQLLMQQQQQPKAVEEPLRDDGKLHTRQRAAQQQQPKANGAAAAAGARAQADAMRAKGTSRSTAAPAAPAAAGPYRRKGRAAA